MWSRDWILFVFPKDTIFSSFLIFEKVSSPPPPIGLFWHLCQKFVESVSLCLGSVYSVYLFLLMLFHQCLGYCSFLYLVSPWVRCCKWVGLFVCLLSILETKPLHLSWYLWNNSLHFLFLFLVKKWDKSKFAIFSMLFFYKVVCF